MEISGRDCAGRVDELRCVPSRYEMDAARLGLLAVRLLRKTQDDEDGAERWRRELHEGYLIARRVSCHVDIIPEKTHICYSEQYMISQ